MTADEVIADWVPWSTGEAARFRTKAEAVADLRSRLFEAGFKIVPQSEWEAVLAESERVVAGYEKLNALLQAMVKATTKL